MRKEDGKFEQMEVERMTIVERAKATQKGRTLSLQKWEELMTGGRLAVPCLLPGDSLTLKSTGETMKLG